LFFPSQKGSIPLFARTLHLQLSSPLPRATNGTPPKLTYRPLQPAVKPDDFEAFYLKAVTEEFADDIDKMRNASDFSAESLPILIAALKQGAALYGPEERARIMKGVKGRET
jgi:hypothetical protein